jgi:hypothetical protein
MVSIILNVLLCPQSLLLISKWSISFKMFNFNPNTCKFV